MGERGREHGSTGARAHGRMGVWEHGSAGAWERLVLLLVLVLERNHDDTTAQRKAFHHEGLS
jgi:hypothetical protein